MNSSLGLDQETGYLHPLYAQSFSDIGTPIFLPKSKGWLIKRQIPNTPYFDAMGPYPMFFCENWGNLIYDLKMLREQLVCVNMVLSPLSEFPVDEFRNSLDIFYPYKNHYILDTSTPLTISVSKNKRRGALKALKTLSVDLVKAPNIDLDEWIYLYNHLKKHHDINDIRAFSRDSFSKQITIPGTLFFRVWHNKNLVGGNLYYIQRNVAYGHLLALTDKGYELGAAYAVKWISLQYLSKLVKFVNLGGGTGIKDGEESGLDLFKSGWTNSISQSYFCGIVLQHQYYESLIQDRNTKHQKWFPAYRINDYS